ncbi:PilZ domain-containing protein [Desulfobacula phenolica]|uniref:PilZ domain-containing protein n=1 Tax=Desulfobacula phenolica TaxID=90732 RepID=A0A1H2DP36_9BACT|nr:PilZ domain-containing protein [Desulfobacula phenolica]SDT84534.1 PilZ domain-containing protein [Desulfobacula phenolica]
MGFDISKIMLPSVGVDMVFNINSLAPYCRPSIIYDINVANTSIIIAQPHIPFLKDTNFKELHLTTIIQDKNRKIRLGVTCRQFKIINHFALANNTKVQAVLLSYELPVKETNIRGGFRLLLNAKHLVKGKLRYKNFEYYTSREFSIKDISLSGLSLVIPKKTNNKPNPLCEIKINEHIMIGIILINTNQGTPVGVLSIKTQVVRINTNNSRTYALVGLKILNLGNKNETLLNRFIHDAQIDDLKTLSRRN